MHIHILFEQPLPTRYAVAIQFLHTAHALARSGTRVTVHTGPHHAPPTALLADYDLAPTPQLTLQPLFTGTRSDVGRVAAWLRARDAAADGTPHTLVGRGAGGLVLFAALRRVGPHPMRRAVYEAHKLATDDVRSAWERWRAHRRERAAVRAADGVIVLTPPVASALNDAYGVRTPVLLLPSGTTWTPTLPARANVFATDVIYVGKLIARKGIGLLLGAMRHLPGRTLTIVGGTPAEVQALRAQAAARGLAARVTFTGHVPPRDVPALLQRARVGVCPLPAEGNAIAERYTFPLKVVQMMALGVPIVATDVPSLRAMLAHERTALLAPPNSPEALAGALRRVLDDDALAERLRVAAHAEAAVYTWEQRAAKLRAFAEALHTHAPAVR